MIEELDLLWRPRPTEGFHAPPGPTIARWTEHRRRTVHVAETFGDLARHPWVGERQGGKAANLYTATARNVDAELRALPYAQRLEMPRSGNWPIVVGSELGEGPNPWDHSGRYDQQRKRHNPGVRNPQGGAYGSDFPDTRQPTKTLPDGPATTITRTVARVGKWIYGAPGAGKVRVAKHFANSAAEVGVAGVAAYGTGLFTGNPTAAAAAGSAAGAAYRHLGPKTGRNARRRRR